MKALLTTLAAAALGSVSLLPASASAQTFSPEKIATLTRSAAYAQYTAPRSRTQRYYSPTNPYGYEYGYPRGYEEPTTTGGVATPTGPLHTNAYPDWPGQTWISYCSRRYPTYNPESNTFWGTDGREHLCR
ncbi:BA14K family protein [Microvirga sp. 2TAF3]|uniref:BA14K family protein n=1 Tax=Microvirga sp. 2TAF3 TaxID=3233014 RepID=UPI003F9BBE34